MPGALGWVVATGSAMALTTYLTWMGAHLGRFRASRVVSPTSAVTGLTANVTLLVISFLSYYLGGYVAGRLSNHQPGNHPIRPGLHAWLWGVGLTAATVLGLFAAVGLSASAAAGLGGFFGSFPVMATHPVSSVRINGIVTAAVLAAAGLGGALCGCVQGFRTTTSRPNISGYDSGHVAVARRRRSGRTGQ